MSISIPNFIQYFPNFIYIAVWFLDIKKKGSMIEERKGAALAGNVVAKMLFVYAAATAFQANHINNTFSNNKT